VATRGASLSGDAAGAISLVVSVTVVVSGDAVSLSVAAASSTVCSEVSTVPSGTLSVVVSVSLMRWFSFWHAGLTASRVGICDAARERSASRMEG
jgi:hypothetical protein